MGELGSAAWSKRIGAITLVVEDLAVAKRFYQEVFGLPLKFEDDDSAVFDFGNTLINLLKSVCGRGAHRTSVRGPSRGRRALPADDRRRRRGCRLRRACRRGVELLNGPMDRPRGVRTASFMDPGGHIWEIALTRCGD
jgi:catechol 2,3-dioxygenase-like lactoylglutathione lyase family enzyme